MSLKISDLDNADAILVLGTDPLHEMPILDLRIRKAVRRNGAKLAVASERPTALDGGAEEAVRYAPGDAARFVRALAAALGAEGFEADPAHAKQAAAIAELLREAPDPAIVWGERLWRSPGAAEALHACARALEMHKRIGPGLLEVPEESNGRGLREVGCLPGAAPGLSPAVVGRGAAEIKEGLADGELNALLLLNADPGPHPSRLRGLAAGARQGVRRLRRDVRRRVHSPRRHRPPRGNACREGGHRHPSRRPPPAPPPQRPASRRGPSRLAGSSPSSHRRSAETSASRLLPRSSTPSRRRSRSTTR